VVWVAEKFGFMPARFLTAKDECDRYGRIAEKGDFISVAEWGIPG
jgi:hypothetical protein